MYRYTYNPSSYNPSSYAGMDAAAAPVAATNNSRITFTRTKPLPQRGARLPQERQEFLRDRRSLKVWPIDGDDKDLKPNVEEFCIRALGAPKREKLGIESVRRVRSAPPRGRL